MCNSENSFKANDIRKTLHSISQEIKTDFNDLENQFVEIGDHIGELLSFSGQVADFSDMSVEMIENIGKEKTLMHSFSRTDQEVVKIMKKLENSMENIREFGAVLDNITKGTEFFGNIGKKINNCSFLIKIETSRFKDNDFSYINDMINTMLGENTQIIGRINDSLKKVGEFLSGLNKEISEDSDYYKTVTGGKGVTGEDVEYIITKINSDISGILDYIKERLFDIRKICDSVIVYLQTFDSTRQKFEHVIDNLEKIRDYSEFYTDEEQRLSFFHHMLKIEVTQLENIIKDIEISGNQIFDALGETGNKTSDIVSFIDRIGKVSSGRELEVITERAEINDKIIRKTRLINEKIESISDNIIKSSSFLVDEIQNIKNINEDLKMVSMNAIVKVAHTGNDGRSLGVLANEVRKLSDSIDSVSVNILDKDVQDIRKIGHKIDINKNTSEHEDDFTNFSEKLINEIAHVRESISAVSLNISKINDIAGSFLKKNDFIISKSDFIRKTSEIILPVIGKLNSKLDRISDNILDISIIQKEHLEDIRSAYTMKSEVDIHNSVSGDDQTSDYEDFSDIELF